MTGDYVANTNNMYEDIYFGMQFTFSGHYYEEIYNGVYTALDYLYNSETRFIHFRNTNGMYLFFYSFGDEFETYGSWFLNYNENQSV